MKLSPNPKLSNPPMAAKTLKNIIQLISRYVTLICVEHLCEKKLQLSSHCVTGFHSLGFYFIRFLVNLHLHALNRVEKKFFSHVWQEEKGLNKGVEVAGVTNVLESNRDTLRSHSLV